MDGSLFLDVLDVAFYASCYEYARFVGIRIDLFVTSFFFTWCLSVGHVVVVARFTHWLAFVWSTFVAFVAFADPFVSFCWCVFGTPFFIHIVQYPRRIGCHVFLCDASRGLPSIRYVR